MAEYQLTIQGYEEAKNSIKENLYGIGKSFVMIGWQLKRIEESGRYREDGYSSIAEFAKAEYNMSADSVSKYKKVYETFSVPGDRPEIQERYQSFEFSKLVEMRQLPEEDRNHLHPETYREDIRDLKEYNREQENSPAKLLNWQQEAKKQEEILKDTIREYFQNKKKTLNELYASEAYSSGSIKEMADIVYKDKSTFKTENAFIMFHRYPTPLFAKIGQNEAEELTWEDFLRTMRELFDQYASGKHTYEAAFEEECQEMTVEEENGSERESAGAKDTFDNAENEPKNVEKSQETAQKSGILHEKRFPNCIYKTEQECTGSDCQECTTKKDWLKEKKEERQKGKEIYPHFDSNTVFDLSTARMVRSFLDNGYTSILPHGTKRFRAMGAEFAVVLRPGRGDFVFYDQFGRTLCYISKERMEKEYLDFTDQQEKQSEEFAPAQQKNETLPEVGCCAYDSRKTCTLTEAQKHIPGNGENCSIKCCWNCTKHGNCKLECDASANRVSNQQEEEAQIPGQDNIMNHPEYLPELTIEEAVKALCEDYPDILEKIMRACRMTDNNGEAAKQAQKIIAPYGCHGRCGGRIDYDFRGFAGGVEIEINGSKVHMKYGRLIVEAKKIYDPWSPRFDSEKERCQEAAEQPQNAAKRQQSEAWPECLKDIPIPSKVMIDDILEEAEKEMNDFLSIADQGLPKRTLLKHQLITGGLRLIRKLVEDYQQEVN